MKSAVVTLALLVCMLAANPACASNWRSVSATDDARLYIDVDSIKTTNSYSNYKQAWERIDYLVKQRDGRRSAKVLVQVKCNEQEAGVTYELAYSGVSGAGELVSSRTIPLSYTPVAPDTVGELMVAAVCADPVAADADAG